MIFVSLRVDARHRLAGGNIRVVQESDKTKLGTQRIAKVYGGQASADSHFIGQSRGRGPAPGSREKRRGDMDCRGWLASENGRVKWQVRSARAAGESQAERMPRRGQIIQPRQPNSPGAAVVLPSPVLAR